MRFVGSIFEPFGEVFRAIGISLQNISSSVVNGIRELFTVDADYFSSRVNEIKDNINTKLGFISNILNQFKNVNPENVSDLYINIMGVNAKILDLSFINSVKSTYYTWIRVIMYIMLVYYNYRKVMNLFGAKVSDGGDDNDN